jgi:hypothetical protein
MLNFGSIFNTAILAQRNDQRALNLAIASPFTTQTAVQVASNNAQVAQGR